MKIQASQIRPGMVIEHQSKKWSVMKIQLIQPGKGGAFIQVEMRDIDSGNKTNERWRTADTVEKLMVEQRDFTFLFGDADQGFTFMDAETFDQITLSTDVLGDQHVWLQDNMEVVLDYVDGDPVSVTLPAQVTMEVVEADAVVKGQTASSSYKPGILENGQKVMIPPHIAAGTRVVVSTADGSYVERAKD